ncbi:MAG: M20 family metallo-hydrolase [Chloroflexi bacterium]|nr:MAG: M20 family metallo-hydrolase [Chloroflexota bacterium]
MPGAGDSSREGKWPKDDRDHHARPRRDRRAQIAAPARRPRAARRPPARRHLSASVLTAVELRNGPRDHLDEGSRSSHQARRGGECVRSTRILECVAICEEEGSRFDTNFWGARAIADRLEPGEAERVRDRDGVPLADAMRAVSLDPAITATAVRRDLDVFVELHIEQGPILEDHGPRLGLVTTIAGTAHLEITVRGQADHAGAMAMDRRRDAFLGAAAISLAIADAAVRMGHPAVATVGTIAVEPSQVNVVPGLAKFTVDTRHPDPARRSELITQIGDVSKRIASERGLTVEIRTLRDRPPVTLSPRIIEVLRRAAAAAGVEPREMTSGAGHDAQVLAAAANVGMLFVPSIGGRSHCPEEATAAEDVVLGTRVLATALRDLAYQP